MTIFGTYLCAHLAQRDQYRLGYLRHDLKPEDIVEVNVRWDNGENYNPTFPSDNNPPTLEMSVSFRPRPDFPDAVKLDRTGTLTKQVEPEWALTALMQLALGHEPRG